MDTNLQQLYYDARYHIYPCNEFVDGYDIFVDDKHQALDRWLKHEGFVKWAFITAWNPGSQPLSLQKNIERNKSMANELKSEKFHYLDAAGYAPDDSWMEVSFLVLNISKERALSLAKKYGQNAIIFGEIGRRAELVIV